MEDPTVNLDIIDTQWSIVQRAHSLSDQAAAEARSTLVLRYSRSIRRYIGAICQNDHEADELAQEAVVRLMSGDFAGADVNRGRFRDLLKVSVRNMVRDSWKRKKRRQGVNYDVSAVELDVDDEALDEHDQWVTAWRNDLLELTWEALRQYEESRHGSIAYSVLRLRADHPNDNADALIQKLQAATGRTISSENLRQQLRRSRVRFAQLLVQEVAEGLSDPASERVEDELIALGLFDYLRKVLGKIPL